MKRQWRAGRMVLAVMLVGIAVGLCALWQRQPRWQMESQSTVGIDEIHQLLLTQWSDDSAQSKTNPLISTLEVRGYHLSSGHLIFRQQYQLNMSSVKPEDRDFLHWDCLVSPRGDSLIAFARNSGLIEVHELSSGALRWRQRIKEQPFSSFETIGVSSSGKYFAAFSYSDQMLWIWDLETGTQLAQASIPNDFEPGAGIITSPRVGIQFSPDDRLLAVDSNYSDMIVYDLRAQKLIGRGKELEKPRFPSPDLKLTAFLSNNKRWTPIRLKVEADRLTAPPDELERLKVEPRVVNGRRVEGAELLLATNSTHFVTAQETRREIPSWISLLPDLLGKPIKKWLGYPGSYLEIEVRKLTTGEKEHAFTVQVACQNPIEFNLPSEGIGLFGEGVIILDVGEELVAWDVPPRRPVSCWITCGVLSLVALWLAWPRRVKARLIEPITGSGVGKGGDQRGCWVPR